jgi:hypothetical protein
MSKFQVLKIVPRAGISSKNQKPYNMLIVSGLHTDDLGQVEMGEVIFMEGQNSKIPNNLVPGQTYTPVISASSRDGKLSFGITSFVAISKAA